MPTPLYTALKALSASAPLRLHMPGHHGKPMPIPEFTGWAGLDFTELPPTGDLFSPGGPIEEAEALWSAAWGMSACLFLTGGSTQGLHTALALACHPGEQVLVDRGSHRAVYYALALLDLRPHYLPRPWLPQAGLTGPISPQAVENFLQFHPNCKTVCITSPTYYGVLSNIPAISAVVHAHGGTLLVDAAHGAHLPFLGENPFLGADLVVASAHKTLPAPGQSALLFSGGAFSLADLRRMGSVYGSSSPSYPMMAALDAVRDYMQGEGRAAYGETVRQVALLRARYPMALEAPQDPARLVISCGQGFAAKERLESLGVYPELADSGHLVFLPTCADGPADFARLGRALEAAQITGTPAALPPPPEPPEQVLTPRRALFSPQKKALPLREAEGCVSADQIAPYPPGIPVIAPGERVEKKQLSYLAQIGYNVWNQIGVLPEPSEEDVP